MFAPSIEQAMQELKPFCAVEVENVLVRTKATELLKMLETLQEKMAAIHKTSEATKATLFEEIELVTNKECNDINHMILNPIPELQYAVEPQYIPFSAVLDLEMPVMKKIKLSIQ